MYWYVHQMGVLCTFIFFNLGQRFAILVSKVALAYSLKNFVFDRVETTKVPLELDNGSPFILNKGGLYLKVTKV